MLYRLIMIVIMSLVICDLVVPYSVLNVSEDSRKDSSVDHLDFVIEGKSLKRFKRSFINGRPCAINFVKLFGQCVDCETYEEATGKDCPVKRK